ncbi:MAG: NF038122 family metalloprotease, partial [Planctomycetota bacterium]|nr:NF038122 family metalloprotease [Planctomycetota bacterium]
MKNSQKNTKNQPQRRMFLETLEDRRLLAGVPELAGIQTNNGDLLGDGDVLTVAPREVILNFNQDAELDPSTLDSITLLRSGGDGDFNVASATSLFGTGGAVNIAFSAQAGGIPGNGIQILVSKSDHNNASGPTVIVDTGGTTILVDLNTNAGNETTANLLVDALNTDTATSALIRASIKDGDADTDITAADIDYSPILLSGSNDEVIEPGYIGVDESDRQIVFRFAEALTDETYQISVRGTGAAALSDLDGSVFEDGEGDFSQNFKLDLGPQVEAVVPQPVVRDPALGLQQLKDTIHVYFNDDNLATAKAEDKDYYPLVFTKDTVENTDDIVFFPTEVSYSPGADLVVLKYASDLDELAGAGAGTFRLRIGAKEYLGNAGKPVTPIQLNLDDAGASYDSSTTIGKTMTVSGDGVAAADGTAFDVNASSGATTAFEFDGGVILRVPDGTFIFDGANFEVGDGAQTTIFEFDENGGGLTDPAHVAIVYTGGETAEEMADLVATALTNENLNVERNLLGGGEIHLGWSTGIFLNLAGANGLEQEGNTTTVDPAATRVQVINRASFSSVDVASAISSAINAAGLDGVSTSRDGTLANDARIALVGVDSVTESPVFNVAVFESLIVQGTVGDDGFDTRNALPLPGAEDEIGHRDIRVQSHLLVDGAYLTVPTAGFVDGELIEITNQLQRTVFEFDNDGVLADLSFVPINFAGLPTQDQFADLLVEFLPTSPHVFSASNLGGGVVSVLLSEGFYVDGLDTELVVEQAPAARGGVTSLEYSFPLQYGVDPLGNTLLNAITENQKQRAREIFEMYGQAFGISFIETVESGLKIVTGDMRAIDQTLPIGPGGVLGVASFGGDNGLAIMDLQDFQNAEDDEYGGPWFNTAFHEIGHLLGLGHTDALAPFTVMNSDANLGFGQAVEERFPGDHDTAHGQHLYGVRTGDLDLYEIDITESGKLNIETFAERLADVSLFDTAVSVFRDVMKVDDTGTISIAGKELVARNDDYFSEDSRLELDVVAGRYYIGISSTGNNSYDPAIDGTGQSGKTQGDYELRLTFSRTADDYLTDETGVNLDADGDGVPGGTLNTWFNVTDTVGPSATETTLFVDKSATDGGDGSLASPHNNLTTAMEAANAGDIVRVVGNAGDDGDASTLTDNEAYELGFHPLTGLDLPDGDGLIVKQGVTLMVDAGVVIKSRRARIARGSSSSMVDGSGGAIQMLGTPRLLDSEGNLLLDAEGNSVPGEIYLTSLFDRDIGLHTTTGTEVFNPAGGDWGGIDLRDDKDANRPGHVMDSEKGEFVDLINHTTIQFGGGVVVVGGNVEIISPIHLTDARPTITNNTIQFSANAAVSATPNSFEETSFQASEFQATPFTPDYSRVGPEIRGNIIVDNSINGMLVRIATPAGDDIYRLDVAARFDDLDIVHVLAENLIIDHGAGGPEVEVDELTGEQLVDPVTGGPILKSRLDSSLIIDPGTVVKLDGARIDMTVGTLLLAEGNEQHEVVLTSVLDSRYGAGGTFDTANQQDETVAVPGDWSGLYASPFSNLSVDHTVIAYGGGVSRIEGTFAGFNVIEIRDANARITHSRLEYNESGSGGQVDADRNGRGANDSAVIFVTGDQPVIAENIIQHNLGAAINLGVNDLNYQFVQDFGKQTGRANPVKGRVGNQGPLIQHNLLDDNAINGMVVRGGTLTTEGVWDDTDIVHVVTNSIHVPDFHTYGGLRLESDARESLVVKLANTDPNNPAGFTANGKPLDIDDRIGGVINILGQPHFPVVMTSIADDTVGAGYTPDGRLQTDTANDSSTLGTGPPTTPTSTEITVNLGPGIAPDSTLALRILDAVDLWESILHDPISLTLDMNTEDIGGGVAGFMASTTSVGVIAYDDVRSAMIADGTAAEKTLLNQLPTFAQLNTVGGTAEDTVLISQANAKALESLDISGVTWNRSGSCWTACDGYFAIEETYNVDNDGIIQLITHEIGHALGYIGGPPIFQNNLSPLDMFRLEPGAGAANFTTAPRVMDEGRDAVFYDGIYDPAALTAPAGLTVGDIPMSTGGAGDGFQTSHYKNRGLNGGTYIGVMDPVNDPSPEANGTDIVLDSDKSVLGLIGWDTDTETVTVIGNTPSPGDWDGLNLLQFSHDRNLSMINERETDDHSQPIYENPDPANSQYVGQLASREYSGDETLRLGFQIQGTIETPTDQDMYRFEAVSGTEIWLDIDRTEAQLDTVVELVDHAGRVLYQSDNSSDGSLPLTNPDGNVPSSVFNSQAQPLSKSVHGIFDQGTTNPKDAGMRFLLPGVTGLINTYHVRVRSADQLVGGSYELQIRLQERDEIPGSSIQFADIRFATTGVEVVGLPTHSPLAGEIAEDATSSNDTAAGAQAMGNLLETDRAVLSVAGNLDTAADVDFYSFDVSYADVQTQGTGVSGIFDLDYADGLARANTSLNVFDSAGNLILIGTDSNIADDRPAPLQGTDLDDISRGTVGPLDPFIGTVELPVDEAGSYLIAVTNETVIPAEMDQFYNAAAPNPLLRLEPINSVDRVVEERFDGTSLFVDNESLVPYFLGDVVLFVSADSGGQTSVTTVDGFTGQQETIVSGGIGSNVEDVALRPDQGFMYGFTVVNAAGAGAPDTTVGNYLRISTGDGSIMNLDAQGNPPDDGVSTFQDDGLGGEVPSDHGMHYDAIVFGRPSPALTGFVVGHRPDNPVPPFPVGTAPVDTDRRNILYQFDIDTGEALSAPADDRQSPDTLSGAATNIVERGILDTLGGPTGLARKLLLAPEATVYDTVADFTTSQITDGLLFYIDDDNIPGTPSFEFEFNGGPEIFYDMDAENGFFLRDGDSFSLDTLNFEFTTGPVFVVTADNGAGLTDGETFTITDDGNVSRTFEFDSDSNTTAGNEVVIISNTMTQGEIVTAMESAINAATGFNTQATALAVGSNRITLTQDSFVVTPQETSAGLQIEGGHGIVGSGTPIQIEETDTNLVFGQNMANAFATIPSIQMGLDGHRINFLGATDGSFTTGVNRGVFVDQGANGTTGVDASGGTNRISVPFLAEETSDEIALRILVALNNNGISASQDDSVIELTGVGVVDFAQPPLRIAGSAPGGDITGMAFIGSTLYAISDNGGFYTIDNPLALTGTASANYIASSAADLQGINFQGLAAGPTATENGKYAQMLFGIDAGGRIHAFDTAGELQPVFVDGTTSIATGIGNADGLDFSTIEENPWSLTAGMGRGLDAGHGRLDSYDGTQLAEIGGNSLHFGTGLNPVQNFPGGTHGTVETNEFSLLGYSAEDKPTLYFNYFLETEGAQGIRNENPLNDVDMMDSFRVFAGDESGKWVLLGTNNSFDDLEIDPNIVCDDEITPRGCDELDLYPRNEEVQVQDVFDNSNTWRQARVDLAAFAGMDHLKLRFDFSSAGDTNTGDVQTTGTELRVTAPEDLRDGDQFEVDGVTFELDLGYTLVAPTGAALSDGGLITVNYGFNVSAQLVIDKVNSVGGAGTILINDDMTAKEVAEAVNTAINKSLPRQTINGNLGGVAEPNDQLIDATPVNFNGLSGTYQATQAEIGDNTGLVGNLDEDVDILKVAIAAGSTIRVNTDTSQYSNELNTVARLFDADGIELAFSDNDPGPGDAPGTDSYFEFTVATDGDYFVGISGLGNSTYDPTDTIRQSGSTGRYDLTVDVDIEAGFTQIRGNRINLPNPLLVTNDTEMILEGDVGVVGGIRVPIHAGMSDSAIASRIQVAFANTFANGELDAFKRYGSVVRLIGHSVTDRGPLGLTERMPGDEYGNFESNRRGQDASAGETTLSSFEGVYVDDIIVGFAERGEMVTGANADTTFVTNGRPRANQITTGHYQLELRQGTQHVDFDASGRAEVKRTWDTNDRLGSELALRAQSGHDIVEGTTFVVSDGYPNHTVTFEFDDVNINDGVDPGHFGITFDPSASSEEMALLVRDALNANSALSEAGIIAGLSNGVSSAGIPTDDTVNLYGPVFVDPDDPLTVPFGDSGDSNVAREQGQVVIGQNTISDSAAFGVTLVSTVADADGNFHQGPPRVGRELNTFNLIPGVVVSDNLMTDNVGGGISLAGNAGGGQVAAVPFARLINNTIVGTGGGTGIEVTNNASPTLLNNILNNLDTGIDVDASSGSTIIGGTLYANNTTDVSASTAGKGDFAIDIDAVGGDPLFMDADSGNYYLAPGAMAIDSAIESLVERDEMHTLKAPLGIADSPIIVSDHDALGQRRVDDPSVSTPVGIGHEVFKDRGALDRADFVGPQAVIVSPLDNTAPDRDPAETIITIRNHDLDMIAIQLVESENSRDLNGGSGVNDGTVQSSALTLFKDGVRMEPRFDYTFEYDAVNDIIRLIPLAGKFSVDSTYKIEMTTAGGIVIQTESGDLVNDGELFTVEDLQGNISIFEFDSGYAMRVPAALTLTVPEGGGSVVQDAEFFTITSGSGNQVFEFDRDGAVQTNAVAISFDVADDEDDMALLISTALASADIGLLPHARGDGEVHVGSSSEHSVTTANTIVTLRGITESVLDGEFITVDNGTKFQQIEFDTDGVTLPETTEVISVNPGMDNEDIAVSIVDAITQAGLGLAPTHGDDGEIHVGGDRLTVLDTSSSSIVQFGEPGTRTELGLRIPSRAGQPFGLVDGEVFTISDGTTTVNFELDNDGTTIVGNRAVTFSATSSLDQVTNTVVSQIQLSNLGLTASNLGDGFIELLGSNFSHSINVGTSGLKQIGFPGVEAT